MTKNRFVVSDETLNCYGCVVLTSGINTAQFERNPIMLYMHDREAGVIGRWEDIRKEGGKLMATAVFDEGTELGAKVMHQVDTGFLRAASVGLENVMTETRDGIETIVSCDLIEISIVDVPANGNAVKLFKKGWKPVMALSELKGGNKPMTTEGEGLHQRLVDVLGLDDKADDNAIVAAVKALVNSPSKVDKEVEDAVAHGLIPSSERKIFRAMAEGNATAFRKYIDSRKERQVEEIDQLLKRNSRKVYPAEQWIFKRIGECMGADFLREVFSVMYEPIRLGKMIRDHTSKDKWTLEEYRKYDPESLRADPALYRRLLAEERGGGNPVKDLDYYRRNDPAYLAEHPDFYRQLIDNQQNSKL